MNEISGSSYNYNFTTRKIKIAYKRWNKKCKIEGITDIFNTSFMESALFIIALSQKRQEYPEKTFDEIINEVQLQHDSMFEKKQQDMLDYIEKYADAQHLSEHEKSELLTRKKQELVEEKRKYEEQRKMNLELFDYKYDKGAKPDNSKAKSIIEKLKQKGYKAFLIDELKIINALGKGIKDISSSYFSKGYEIVTSGTFFFNCAPLGTVITNNQKPLETKEPKAIKRGGVAVLKSGVINLKQCNSNSVEKIKELFCDNPVIGDITFPEISERDEVSEFLGGGGLLVDNGKKISSQELFIVQLFDQIKDPKKKANKDGIEADQFRKTYHIVIAEYDELVYLIFPAYKHYKKGFNLQEDLCELGFSYVIKFDGGKGLYISPNPFPPKNNEDEEYKNVEYGKDNPSGFAIKVVKL